MYNFTLIIVGLLQPTSKIGVATVFYNLFRLFYISAYDGRYFMENQAEI